MAPHEGRKRRGGRPRLNPEAKATYFNMRTTPELRARIEASKESHGSASLVQEVERLVLVALEVEAEKRAHAA